MRHQPHLYIPKPWTDDLLGVPGATTRHLSSVLRQPEGAAVTYTDGVGRFGTGAWTGDRVERGEERSIDRPVPTVRLAVAPPRSKDRQRFIVEKLQELAVDELLWLSTSLTQVPPPKAERTSAWAIAALEQSRGAHLMHIGSANLHELGDFIAADPNAQTRPGQLASLGAVAVAVGPEGGFTDQELEGFAQRVSLGGTVLRVETAAITVAAANRM